MDMPSETKSVHLCVGGIYKKLRERVFYLGEFNVGERVGNMLGTDLDW